MTKPSLYWSIVILNVNGLNSPLKRHREDRRMKNNFQIYAASKRLILFLKTIPRDKFYQGSERPVRLKPWDIVERNWRQKEIERYSVLMDQKN